VEHYYVIMDYIKISLSVVFEMRLNIRLRIRLRLRIANIATISNSNRGSMIFLLDSRAITHTGTDRDTHTGSHTG